MKQEKQALIIVAGLLIFIVLFIGIIIAKGNAPESYKYNDYQVLLDVQGNYRGYQTEVYLNGQGPVYMSTRYGPRDLEDIPVGDIRDTVVGKGELFIHVKGLNESFGSRTTVAALEFNNLIERFYSVEVKYEENEKDCSAVDLITGVVEYRLGDKTEVYPEDGCLIIEAISEEDFIRASDRVIFYLLGIMEK